MEGIAGLRKLLKFCLAQDAILLMFAVLSLILLGDALKAGAPDADRIFVLAELVVLLSVLSALYVVWSMVQPHIELLWNIKWKGRIESWMMRAIAGGAILAAASFLMVALIGLPTDLFGWSVGASIELATLIPFAVSLVLTAGLIKRYLEKKNMFAAMSRLVGLETAGQSAAFERIRASLATEWGNGSTSVRPNPQGFAFAGITSKPWHDTADFPWIKAFEDASAEIRAEAMKVLQFHEDSLEHYSYPGLDGKQWRSFSFVARYEENPGNLAKCPVTAGLLKTIPGYPNFRDAMFSILEPGGLIDTHRDSSNVFLTMHLGLVTPGNGFLEAGGVRREWVKDKALVFDSSYEHRAANFGTTARVILLVDFLHPDISAEEREWVAAARL